MPDQPYFFSGAAGMGGLVLIGGNIGICVVLGGEIGISLIVGGAIGISLRDGEVITIDPAPCCGVARCPDSRLGVPGDPSIAYAVPLSARSAPHARKIKEQTALQFLMKISSFRGSTISGPAYIPPENIQKIQLGPMAHDVFSVQLKAFSVVISVIQCQAWPRLV